MLQFYRDKNIGVRGCSIPVAPLRVWLTWDRKIAYSEYKYEDTRKGFTQKTRNNSNSTSKKLIFAEDQ